MLDKSVSPTERASHQVLRWPTPRSRDWIETFLDSARKNPNIIAIVAVGSAVRPGVPSVDLDLVVLCRDPDALDEVPPMEVDLRAYPEADIDGQLKSGHDMLGWAVRFGRVLFQRDSFWDKVVDSWRQRLPLPSSKLARARAAAAYRHLTNVLQFGDADAAHEQALSYLTHLARAELLERGIYPASRPELAQQLRGIGSFRLAELLDRVFRGNSAELSEFDGLVSFREVEGEPQNDSRARHKLLRYFHNGDSVVPKVFLSHSGKDKDFVRELYRRLKRDGVTCFFDEESIEWGANFVVKLEKAIDACEFFVPVLSPDFVQSKWVELERTSALADDPAGVKRKTRPLLLRPCDVPRFLKPIQNIDVSTSDLFEKNYPKICAALGGTVRPDPEPPRDRTVLPPVTPLPALHRLPYRSLDGSFVGRVDSLWSLYDQLSQGKTSIVQGVGVVFGTGGLGKTQLAVEYAHRFNCHYPGGVFWVEADQGIARLIDVLCRSAEVEVDSKRPEADQLEEAWAALNRRAAILIILDNFPENTSLEPWLPPGGSIHVLVTTRRRDLTRHPRVSLPLLTTDEGLALLNSGSRRFGEDAKRLVEDVGGLPLALELLRAYLGRRADIDIVGVRRALAAAGEMTLLQEFAAEYRDELPTRHERNVAATFQVSWNLAGEDGKDVLRVMAHLAPAPVPLRLLRASLGWEESSGLGDRLSNAMADLWRLSLVERNELGEPSAHRLVLAFGRHFPESASRWPQAVAAVRKEMERALDEKDTASFRELEAVLPHAEAILAGAGLSAEDAIDIATDLGSHHRTLGRYQQAKSLWQEALARAERSYPPGHPSIATRQSNLALVLQDLGDLEEARELLRKALASYESSYPPDHPSIATTQSNLAAVLRDLGELEEARDLLREALASDERSYPPGHPDIATRQSNLAMVLKDLGELGEARDLLRKALASNERSYPAGHPSIAISQSNLAAVLKGLGELEEARDLLRKALASDLRSYPPGHPDIAIRQSNLGMVLKDLGELKEARELLEKAYATALATLGPNHPNTRTFQANLASLPGGTANKLEG